ncbi:MAG: phosphodiester glycosidase family protein [Cyanobacteria bacterium P01_H01_bin.153]
MMSYRTYRQGQRLRRIAALLFAILAGSWGLSGCVSDLPQPPATPNPQSAALEDMALKSPAEEISSQIAYQTHQLSNSTVHVVTVPAKRGFHIGVTVSDTLAPLSAQAEQVKAIAAINAGFFDPQNSLTTSYVIVDGAIIANPQDNDRLVSNPDLQAYLPAILNRSEFRIYDCEGRLRYDITLHNAPLPISCTLDAAVGAGPQLLPTMTGYQEGFMADNAAGEQVRDVLGSQTANARSALGIKADGTVVLAMASRLAIADAPTGVTFAEMTDLLVSLDVVKALNLDGGSSSSLYFEGITYWGRLDSAGVPIQRPIKSILYVY